MVGLINPLKSGILSIEISLEQGIVYKLLILISLHNVDISHTSAQPSFYSWGMISAEVRT